MSNSTPVQGKACWQSSLCELTFLCLNSQIFPESFLLPSHSVHELRMCFKPMERGRFQARVHIMDEELNRIVEGFLIGANAVLPITSQMFKLEVMCGRKVKQNVLVFNPYPTKRVFEVVSSDERVMAKPNWLAIGGKGELAVELTATGSNIQGEREVFLFVNDEEGNMEDCYKIELHVVI